MPTPIIHDCDPGHDDAVALLLALASPELELLGVTVSHGNVALDRTLHNALALRELAGASVPIYAGADRPLVRAALHAPHIHGESGVGSVALPEPTQPAEALHAAEFIAQTALNRPGEVTLVVTGPLTNLALALRLEPRLAGALRGAVLMGGSADHGNTTPAAEFNFVADPHAARIVFESGLSISMFGLNLTRQVRVTRAREAQFRAVGTRCAVTCADFLDDYLTRLEARGRGDRGALHDPCTVAYLLNPELFELQAMSVQIDTQEGQNFGRSLCDVLSNGDLPPNAQVAMRADEDGVYGLIAERLGRLP